MKKDNVLAYFMAALFAIILNACGNDGGGGETNTTASSQWNTMKWDQGTWK